MAVIKTIITERNVEYYEQYCRVEAARVEKNNMRYDIGIYFNQAATENPPHRIETFEAPFDLFSDQNVWQQVYTDLKINWPDAVDA